MQQNCRGNQRNLLLKGCYWRDYNLIWDLTYIRGNYNIMFAFQKGNPERSLNLTLEILKTGKIFLLKGRGLPILVFVVYDQGKCLC